MSDWSLAETGQCGQYMPRRAVTVNPAKPVLTSHANWALIHASSAQGVGDMASPDVRGEKSRAPVSPAQVEPRDISAGNGLALSLTWNNLSMGEGGACPERGLSMK